jgi:hypothetical protein
MAKILLAAIVLLMATSAARTQEIDMSGLISYNQIGNFVNLQVQRIDNYRPLGSISGTLVLQLWATSTMYTGLNIFGYKIGEANLGQLRGRYFWSRVNQTVPYFAPPNGTRNIVLVLSEWHLGSYRPVDWHNFGFTTIGPVIPQPTPADQEPPTLVLASPVENVTSTRLTSFTLRGTTSDNVRPTRLEYRVQPPAGNYTKWQRGTLTGTGKSRSWSQAVDLPTEGAWRVQVRVADAAGNRSVVVTRTIVVDRTRPVVMVSTPSGGRVSTSKARFTLKGTASDNMTAVRLDFRVRRPGGSYGAWEALTLSGSAIQKSWERQVSVNALGEWRVQIRTADRAGNVSGARTIIINRL